MGKWTDAALKVKPILQKGAQHLDDAEALEVKGIYDEWEAGVEVKVHEKRTWDDKLYRCRQAHTTEKSFPPPMIPALWVVIDEENAGTIDQPIPAVRGMEYTYFLYYLDPEDGKTYLCQHGDTDEQGTIILQYLPHEVVGIYFKLADEVST